MSLRERTRPGLGITGDLTLPLPQQGCGCVSSLPEGRIFILSAKGLRAPPRQSVPKNFWYSASILDVKFLRSPRISLPTITS
jgi:hypothetical protein